MTVGPVHHRRDGEAEAVDGCVTHRIAIVWGDGEAYMNLDQPWDRLKIKPDEFNRWACQPLRGSM
jgi:hypothetical protein